MRCKAGQVEPAAIAVKERFDEANERFCRFYTMMGNDTYHDAAKAALAAGYSPKRAAQTGRELVRKPKVIRRLALLEAENAKVQAAQTAITLELLRFEHHRLARLNESLGNMGEARANWEDLGKMIGAYSEVVQLDLSKMRRFTEAEEVEARRVSALLLEADAVEGSRKYHEEQRARAGAGESLPSIPASVVPESPVDPVPAVVHAPSVTAPVDGGETVPMPLAVPLEEFPLPTGVVAEAEDVHAESPMVPRADLGPTYSNGKPRRSVSSSLAEAPPVTPQPAGASGTTGSTGAGVNSDSNTVLQQTGVSP
jgi:phage terminase small subunit